MTEIIERIPMEPKIIEEIVERNGKSYKVTKKIEQIKVTKKVKKAVAEREKWERFGLGKTRKTEEGISVETKVEDELIFLSDSMHSKKSQGDEKKLEIMKNRLADLQQKRINEDKATLEDASKSSSDTPAAVLDAANKAGRYIPPSLRGTLVEGSMRYNEDEFKVRVSNLADDITEDELRYIFGNCGTISKVYMSYDWETQRGKGFAFIAFHDRESVEYALQYNGKSYNHLKIAVEPAKPSIKK